MIGFFEFAFMRVRSDLPQKEIAEHMVAYAHDEPDFARAVFAGKTQVGRTLVHEDAVDPADLTHILDHERATHIVKDAKAWAVSLCYCRHIQEHEGKACGKPTEVCTTLNSAADYVIRHGLGRKISKEEALDIFARDSRGRAGPHRGQREAPSGVCLPLLRLLLRHALRHQPVQDVRRGRHLALRGGGRSGEMHRLRDVLEEVPRGRASDRGRGEGKKAALNPAIFPVPCPTILALGSAQ